MRRILLLSTILLLTALGCRQDQRERLFEMVFPPLTFQMPAGTGGPAAWVQAFPSVPTNIDFYLEQNKLDLELIEGIQALSSRITSLDGFDLDFFGEIQIRICNEGDDDCARAAEVFYIDNIYRREDDRVELLPGLRNAKAQLSQQRVRIEIVFFLAETSPYAIDGRLDMAFEAVK